MKKDPNEEITVSEFIEDYIFLEGKLKLDNKKYEKSIDDLTQQINKCQESLENAKDEVELSDGLTNKSALFITVIEARNLISENLNLIGDSTISVVLSFQGDDQETNKVPVNPTPSWCESFKFKIIEPNGALRVEIFENNNLMGKKSLGVVSIDLNYLKDQKKRLLWYDLNNTQTNRGSIYLKLSCILNFKHFYQGEIEMAEEQIKIFQNAINITDIYIDNLNTPFGLLFCDDLENLINNQKLKQADELFNYLEGQKEKEKDTILKTLDTNIPQGKMRITLNKLNIVLIYCLVIFSLISLLERSDYYNFALSLLIVYYFIMNKSWNVIKHIIKFIFLFGVAIKLDLVWFIIHFSGFFLGDERDPERGIKRFIYFIGICSCVIKSLFIISLLNLKRRKNAFDN